MPDPRSLFSGKRITVMGLGLLGRGLGDTLFLVRSGARVTVTDLKTAEQLAPSLNKLNGVPVTYRLGEHHPDDFINADMILRNADVPRTSRFLKIATDHGVPVEMDESLFCKHYEGTVIGITGTRGKTTTTTLVHRILSRQTRRAYLAGNIMGHATLPLLGTAAKEDVVVLELSSWQLQGFHDSRISPHASVFTNVYPDHLNRYASMQEYIEDKKAIFRYQTNGDFCLFNGDQAETAAMAGEAPAAAEFFRTSDVPPEWDVRVPGLHNRQNIAAAIRLTRKLGVPEIVVREQVERFSGVEHRLQSLGDKDGIGFINDSTSTTPVAGCAALDAIEGHGILLIAGGSDKNLDLQPFADAAATKCRKIALLRGTATDALHEGIRKAGGTHAVIGVFDDLRDAVRSLYEQAVPDDVILLSPGCASFGLFQNEFHRGESFVTIVEEIMSE
ncbi:MAG TPA: UDP-N-acetylmuramoyl-L-alanine--D-glutamate ligase [Desulfomonilaceae bacterium]|nr:UDP-N-acetylmuramoyl-L-alanine--D-glutamate ligase [Desulfomonilaceae bacterium]